MKTFYDYYQNPVKLSFEDHPFSKSPKHVWVICRYKNQWLLTRHKDRGLEFPGGKVEKGETADEAAVREVLEETGGRVQQLMYVGQYYVEGKGGNVIKNVYYATIEELLEREHYYETRGPVMFQHLPSQLKTNDRFSFMMKDEVLPECLRNIEKKFIQS